MTDWLTPEQRSRNMSSIRSTDNATTERAFLTLLRESRIIGWRRHLDLPGRPDFTFRSKHVTVFIDGCFWHGCPRCGHIPKTNARYWRNKILRNKKRDAFVRRRLRSMGFSVLRVWECELKRSPRACLARIVRAISARQR